MAEREVSVLIGGRAGDGISSAGQIIAHLLARNGYRVHMYFDYPSLIKGGHNFAIVRAAEEEIGAVREQVDFILALNQETMDLHRHRLRDGGVAIYDTGTVKQADGIGIPVKDILAANDAPPVMGNSAIIGAFIRAAGLTWDTATQVLKKSMPKETEKNLRIARRAYDLSEERRVVPVTGKPVLPVLTGNEAISIGLVEADLEMYFSYPMSPTSNILHFLAGYADELHIRVIQPESEIAVILMALGCSYAGTRAAVGTSGGGFCLMTESLSLAGIAELPVLVILGQRTGPSTGLATYSAQSDLHFALHRRARGVPPPDHRTGRRWRGTHLVPDSTGPGVEVPGPCHSPARPAHMRRTVQRRTGPGKTICGRTGYGRSRHPPVFPVCPYRFGDLSAAVPAGQRRDHQGQQPRARSGRDHGRGNRCNQRDGR